MDCYYIAIDVDSDDVICCASNMTDMMEWLLTIFEDAVYIDFCYNYYLDNEPQHYTYEEAYKWAWDDNFYVYTHGIRIEAVEFVG